MSNSEFKDDLDARELLAHKLGQLSNETRLGRKLQNAMIRNLSFSWFRKFVEDRILIEGFEHYLQNRPNRGVVVAANHRTFIDSHLYMTAIWGKGASWPKRVRFPVRANFFYERLSGVMVNFAVTAGAMYPPIYREKARSEQNQNALDGLSEFLNDPDALVGVHPEGTRNKGDDPYDLLPAQPGIGKIVLQSKPVVIPVFVNGVANDFGDTIKKAFDKNARRQAPIIIVFGKPVDYSEFSAKKPRAALYKKCSDKVLAAIKACGEREKEIRLECESGAITDADTRWLCRR